MATARISVNEIAKIRSEFLKKSFVAYLLETKADEKSYLCAKSSVKSIYPVLSYQDLTYSSKWSTLNLTKLRYLSR